MTPNNLFSALIDALGIALLHSLWQIAALLLLVFLLRQLIPSSKLRYTISYAAMVTALGLFITTFAFYYTPPAESTLLATAGADCYETLAVTATNASPSQELIGASIRVAGLGNINTQLISLIWFLGFLLYSVSLIPAIRQLKKLRSRGLENANVHWQIRLNELLDAAGVKRHVQLAYSPRVCSPLTIGTLKPLILLPAGFLMQLPPDQVEAILLHEIAHVRRFDYLANWLQLALKSLFFYHPGIHLLSRWVDEERENACDDFALGKTNDPHTLVRAIGAVTLLSQTPQNKLAMHLTQPNHPIVKRLNRLLHSKKPKSSMSFSRILLPCGLLLSIGLMVAAAKGPHQVDNVNAVECPTESEKPQSTVVNLLAPTPLIAPVYCAEPYVVPTITPRDTTPPAQSVMEAQLARLRAAEARLNAQTERLAVMEERLAAKANAMAARSEALDAQREELAEKVECTQKEAEEQARLSERLSEEWNERLEDQLSDQYEASEDAKEMMAEVAERMANLEIELAEKSDVELAEARAEMARMEVEMQTIYERDLAKARVELANNGGEAVHLTTTELVQLRDELWQILENNSMVNTGNRRKVKIGISPNSTLFNGQNVSKELNEKLMALLDRYKIETYPNRLIILKGKDITVGDPIDGRSMRGSFYME